MDRATGMIVIGMVLAVILTTGMSGNAQSTNMEIQEFIPLTPGDFFDYEFDITYFIQSMIDDDHSDSRAGSIFYKDVTTKYRIDILGVETVTIAEKTYEAYISEQETVMKFTIVDENEKSETKWDMTSKSKQWLNKNTFSPIKTEEITKLILENINNEYESEYSFKSESETTSKIYFSKIDETSPFPLKVGKTWSTLVTYTNNETDKSRYKYGDEPFSDWSFDYSEKTTTETNNYEVMMQTEVVTSMGTFNGLKIKSQIIGSSDYEIMFKDIYGMTVKKEIYDEGTLNMIITLKGWNYQKTKDTDGDGVIDIWDAYPNDKAASIDTDGDGYPDAWNEGMTEKDSTTDLKLDQYPDDSTKWAKNKESSFGFILIILALLISVLAVSLARRRSQ